MSDNSPIDFFISYTRSDTKWASWIAYVLEDDGYTVVVQEWDFVTGGNFVVEMENALNNADRMIAVLSQQYFKSVHAKAEWASVLAENPTGENGCLVPILVKKCNIQGLFRPITYIDLVGITDPAKAEETLLTGVRRVRKKPKKRPPYPGPLGPDFPPNITKTRQSILVQYFFPFILFTFIVVVSTLLPLTSTVIFQKDKETYAEKTLPDSLEVSMDKNCPYCPAMVFIAGGDFDMGSDTTCSDTTPENNEISREMPVHRVTVKSFAISATEITNYQYSFFVNNQRSLSNRSHLNSMRSFDSNGELKNHPVVNVTWSDAERYAEWLSDRQGREYRLPTESEWEYAAKGNTSSTYWWGDGLRDGMANCLDCWGGENDDIVKGTLPVGHFAANPFDLFDTSGNVWEWVRDCWHNNYTETPTDGSAQELPKKEQENDPDPNGCSFRVIRGGSYNDVGKRIRHTCRSTFDSDVGGKSNSLGFRLALTIPDPDFAP